MYGGYLSLRINFLEMLVKTVGGPIAQAVGSLFGSNDFVLSAGIQAQLFNALHQMKAPGQGVVTAGYDQPTFTYDTSTVHYFLGFIPEAVTFSVNF